MGRYMNVDIQKKTYDVVVALQGLEVTYSAHYNGGPLDMARVNNFSIIWHPGAYSFNEQNKVEVRLPGGDIKGHYPISRLRKLVTK